MARYRIGIDLGGTNIAAALVGEDYSIVRRLSVPTDLPRDPASGCDSMAHLCRRLCEEEGIALSALASVGIGSPGLVQEGVVLRADNIGFFGVPLAEMMQERLGCSVTVHNDANAAALGELLAGAGKGCTSLVILTLGTGVGGGVIIDGKILRGCNGAAGEIGLLTVIPGGKPCACGLRGCLEAYCSATALIESTKEAMAAHRGRALWQVAPTLAEVTGKTAWDAMRLGDSAATALVDAYLDLLAVGVSNLIFLLQPEVICIGGGISGEGEALLAPLRERVYGENPYRAVRCPTLVRACLGNDAGIVGAAFAHLHT